VADASDWKMVPKTDGAFHYEQRVLVQSYATETRSRRCPKTKNSQNGNERARSD